MKENVQAARLLEIKDQLARSKLGHGSIPSLKPFRAKGPMKGRVKGTRTPKDSTLTPSMELVTAVGNRPPPILGDRSPCTALLQTLHVRGEDPRLSDQRE